MFHDAALGRADAKAAAALQPLEPARLRYALGYVPWVPPPPEASLADKPRFLERVARAAASRRHTAAGRLLFRLAPTAVVSALRARLK